MKRDNFLKQDYPNVTRSDFFLYFKDKHLLVIPRKWIQLLIYLNKQSIVCASRIFLGHKPEILSYVILNISIEVSETFEARKFIIPIKINIITVSRIISYWSVNSNVFSQDHYSCPNTDVTAYELLQSLPNSCIFVFHYLSLL